MAGEAQINGNIIVRLPDQEAGVLQAPLHIGNYEMCFGGAAGAVDVYFHGYRDVVRRPE